MERRCKKRNTVASEELRCLLHDLPDDLLRQILLHLDSPLWIVRAAGVCKRWRHVVDGGDRGRGRTFLRLAKSLDPPVVVGHYNNHFCHGRRFVPLSPSMPIRVSSLDDLHRKIASKSPAHRTIDPLQVADSHGGLVLLYEGPGCILPHLVVCDPLSRRYREIHHPPPPPNPPSCPRVFLLDGDYDGNISISNFRVLYCFCYCNVLRFYCFSAADGGQWRLVRKSSTVAELNRDKLFCSYSMFMGRVIGRIDKSLYLASTTGSVIVLDNGNANPRMEVAEVDLPSRVRKSGSDSSTFAIVHGASTEPAAPAATASIVHVRGEYLELFRQIRSSGKWVLEHSIPRLSEATRGLQGHTWAARPPGALSVEDGGIIAGGTRLAVLKVSLSRRHGGRRSWLFSLDMDTLRLQVVPDVAAYVPDPSEDPKIIYTLPWPQFLTALPSCYRTR